VGDDAGVHPALGAEPDDPEADVLLRHGVSVLWWVPAPRRGAEGEVSGGAERAVHQGWSPHRPYSGRWPAELALGERRCQRAGSPPVAAARSSARSATYSSTRFVESGYLQTIVVLLV